jgi:hypothetical protein
VVKTSHIFPSYLMSLFSSCPFQYDYTKFIPSSLASTSSKEVGLFTTCQSQNVRLYIISASRFSPHFTSLSTHSDLRTSLVARCLLAPASRHSQVVFHTFWNRLDALAQPFASHSCSIKEVCRRSSRPRTRLAHEALRPGWSLTHVPEPRYCSYLGTCFTL